MNLAEISAEVTTQLRRPDLAAQIKGYVRQVVRQVHAATEFQRDLVEQVVTIESPMQQFKIPLPDDYRRMLRCFPCNQYSVPCATANGRPEFEMVAPNDLFTQSGQMMQDIVYISGPTLVVRAGAAVQYMCLQYYKEHDVRDDTTETWIMKQFPEVIMSGVKARYYQATNNGQAQAEASMFMQDLDSIMSHYGGTR
jgi:hypothetical protein